MNKRFIIGGSANHRYKIWNLDKMILNKNNENDVQTIYKSLERLKEKLKCKD